MTHLHATKIGLLLSLSLAATGCAAGKKGRAEQRPEQPVHQAEAVQHPPGELPTQAFRDEHKEVLVHLEHVKAWAGTLAAQAPEQQRQTAERILEFFQKEIIPHAEWEEQNLYPIVDRLTGSNQNVFTSTMRYEHRIVGRWINELAAELQKPSPDYVAFARRTDNLLGLLWAHFEEEEEVLLPFIDRQMTRAEFEKEVGHGAEH